MQFKPNISSMLIGAVLGAVAVLTVASASSGTLQQGRFHLLAADSYIFKIDTSTGQVWKSFVSSPSKEIMAPNIPALTLEK